MIDLLKRLFVRKPLLQCGGEGLCEIFVKGRLCGSIRYRRPTSDEKLDYAYQLQSGLGSESQIKEVKNSENKLKKCHEILINEIAIPFSRKVFISSKGFVNENNKLIDGLSTEEQFKIISKYFSSALVDLVAQVFSTDGVLKKKF